MQNEVSNLREIAGSYCRYSSELQQSASIDDQQRICRDHAAGLGISISPRFEFSDDAISGTKLVRDGLDRLLVVAREGGFKILFVENLSRLARETAISTVLMKELVEVLGIRLISVGEGIDTSREGWEIPASFLNIMHERYLKDLGRYVLRGQEGVVLAGHSVGDWPFGYSSEPIAGSEATRRGRNAKPRMGYVIDSETAPWVERIYRWFVEDARSMSWIARELTRLGAPKDHRAKTPSWHPSYVRRVLENTKYVGRWPWGRLKNKRNPFDGSISKERRPPEECERWIREFPALRIIDDDLWHAAQRRLATVGGSQRGRRRKSGQLAGSVANQAADSPRHLLAGLLRCGRCNHTFGVCGTRAQYLACGKYLQGQCPCKTRVDRDWAEREILLAIADRILGNETWRDAVVSHLLAEHHSLQQALPARLKEARNRLAEVERKVTRLVDSIENGSAPPELRDRLATRRAERQAIQQELATLELADETRPPAPSEDWVSQQFPRLQTLLAEGGPAAAIALRNLVGGRIVVDDIEWPGRQRRFLRARFSIGTKSLIDAVGVNVPNLDDLPAQSGVSEQFVVEFRRFAEWEQYVDVIMELWHEGHRNEEIAKQFELDGNQVRHAVDAWHRLRGLTPPDGRARWRQMPQLPPLAQSSEGVGARRPG